jgi:hypothetical protein
MTKESSLFLDVVYKNADTIMHKIKADAELYATKMGKAIVDEGEAREDAVNFVRLKLAEILADKIKYKLLF